MSRYPPSFPDFYSQGPPRTVDQLVRPASPPTSRAAAASIVNHLTDIQANVMAILRDCGALTDDRIIAIYRDRHGYVSESSVRTRRSELVEAGLVRSVGTVAGRTGKPVTRWAVTAENVAPDGAGGV